ncbi:MAG: dienelactone hydrolase family protein [Pseudomonadota bacterium]
MKIDYIESQTGIDPIATVIWLHGLGADGHDFEPIVPQLRLPEHLPVRFIFPHAPVRPITINGGMSMRGWYDIKSLAFDERADREGLDESARIVGELIAQEVRRGIQENKIVLMGFSQGGAVSLHAGLRYPEQLAGIGALSTYLPFPDELSTKVHKNNAETPILMAHGTQDPVIPISLAKASLNALEMANYSVEWHEYTMPHSVHPDEIEHISLFLQSVLAGGGSR